MTKKAFAVRTAISITIAVTAIALYLLSAYTQWLKYSSPDESNTTVFSGTITDVYYGAPRGGVTVVFADGEKLRFAYATRSRELYEHLGYSLDELVELLEGEEVVCTRMTRLSWIVEIRLGDITLSNEALTVEQIKVTRWSILILAPIWVAICAVADVSYIRIVHERYAKAKEQARLKALWAVKKQKRKEKAG